MSNIKIDMNSLEFQNDFSNLEQTEQLALIKTLKKITKLTWTELYVDNGLKWELILSKQSKEGKKVYSLRFSKKYRAVALRDGDFLRLLTLHTDHDATYKK